jgi:hypothetical protein
MVKETPIKVRIAIMGWILIVKPIIWLAITLTTIATAEAPMYLIDFAFRPNKR